MLHADGLGALLGAVALGAVHGIEPGHGWPVAASYALGRTNTWASGLAAALVLGVGHLVSSLAVVGVFFYAKGYFDLAEVDAPIALGGGVRIGGPVSLVAGLVLVALGVREYRHGHTHAHDGGHDHEPDDHGHHDHPEDDAGHDHPEGAADRPERGRLARLRERLPVGGSGHAHGNPEVAAERGLLGLAWFAFLLGFAHEEEFEIIALCAGSARCLELMVAYALTVVAGIVGLTALLLAGYERSEATVRRYTPYLPAVSAAVLVTMGVGFVLGVF